MAKRKRRVQKKEAAGKSRAKAVQRKTKRAAASSAAKKGWETRRRRAIEQEREQKRRARARREREREKAEKEARRLAKWRKSYREYLKFKVPKKKREELEVPEVRELICRVLFDADEAEEREEHFWTNLRHLIGDSIGHILNAIPAETGTVYTTFRLIAQEEFRMMQAGGEDNVDEYGDFHEMEWETELDLEAFWTAYFDNARTLLPKTPEGKSPGGTLLVAKMQVCYLPGEVSAD